MRIAIVTGKKESIGGVEIFTRDISKIFARLGHEVDVISREMLSEPIGNGVEEAVGNLFSSMHKQKNYDVVFCNGEFGYGVNHPRAINVFHGNYYGYAKSVEELVDKNLTQDRMEKAKMQRESAEGKYVVTVSDYCARQLGEFGVNVDRVIPLSVDTDIFYPEAVEAEDSSLAISRGRYYEKGFDILSRLASKGVKIRLFSDTHIDSPNVENLGFVKNSGLRSEYSRASIFLNPTRFEGGGLTTLEAMACGCPVITTPTGYGYDIREVVPNFVADNFVGFFTKQLLVSNDRERYSKDAIDYFWEFHNPNDFRSSWTELIKRI
jgi:glycosyltransferase involved in cell wall biosynthesis